MAVELKRKKGEKFESFLRRFNKKLLQSGVLFQARKIRNYQSQSSKNKMRKEALRRQKIKAQKEFLRKTGRLKDDM